MKLCHLALSWCDESAASCLINKLQLLQYVLTDSHVGNLTRMRLK